VGKGDSEKQGATGPGEERRPAPGLLTPDEVCAWFSISKSTLYAWVNGGKIPHIKLGGKLLRFDPAALKVFLDGWQRAPTENNDGCTQNVRKTRVVHGHDDRNSGARPTTPPEKVAIPHQEGNRGLGTERRRRRLVEFHPAADEEV
jgi:excisionase family DNA binding protein